LKTYTCQCGNALYFANSKCLVCGAMVGFLPDEQQLSTLTITDDGLYKVAHNNKLYRQCKNYWQYDVCNWMVPNSDSNELCQSCRLNVMIPNLEKPENLPLWYNMEQAKRRLLYTLMKLKLPIEGRDSDPAGGLGFSFLEDDIADEYGNELTVKNYVVIGHNSGLITINLREAIASVRIEMREKMNEQYRTLIGHFRHESGHYYWDRLIQPSTLLNRFRELFGDERLSYTHAMEQYYKNGPADNWQNVWISAYASMHPWEDWAETWAHYLHMIDTLETANDYEISISSHQIKNPLIDCEQHNQAATAISFTQLFNDWCRLTKSLNAVNRSMGHDDAYPFVISVSALNKLRFVHEVIQCGD